MRHERWRTACRGLRWRLAERLKPLPMGVMGDGSNDRSQTEQEALATRFLGGDGKPFNGFYDLATLDLSTSSDGRSPDAQCITACYATSLDQLNKFEGFLFMSD